MTSHVGLPNGSHMGVASGTPTYGTYGTNGEPTTAERDGFLLSNARDHEQVYLVNWPQEGFVKVGYSSDGKRWRSFIGRGGRLLGLATLPRRDAGFDASGAENLLHVGLSTRLDRAFRHRFEAAPYLGHKGAGWTECYIDDGTLALPMFAFAVDVIRSGDDHAYWQVRDHWTKPNPLLESA